MFNDDVTGVIVWTGNQTPPGTETMRKTIDHVPYTIYQVRSCVVHAVLLDACACSHMSSKMSTQEERLVALAACAWCQKGEPNKVVVQPHSAITNAFISEAWNRDGTLPLKSYPIYLQSHLRFTNSFAIPFMLCNFVCNLIHAFNNFICNPIYQVCFTILLQSR